MKVGDFILTKGNGLIHSDFCICKILEELSHVQTISFPEKFKEFTTPAALKRYPSLNRHQYTFYKSKSISLYDEDFRIALTTHTIREDAKVEFGAFLKNLIETEIKGGIIGGII